MSQIITREADYSMQRAFIEAQRGKIFFAVGHPTAWENEVEPPPPSLEILDLFLAVPVTDIFFAMKSTDGVRGAARTKDGLEGLHWTLVSGNMEIQRIFRELTVPVTHLALEGTLFPQDWSGSFRTAALLCDVELNVEPVGRFFLPEQIASWGRVLWMSTFRVIHRTANQNHRFRVFL